MPLTPYSLAAQEGKGSHFSPIISSSFQCQSARYCFSFPRRIPLHQEMLYRVPTFRPIMCHLQCFTLVFTSLEHEIAFITQLFSHLSISITPSLFTLHSSLFTLHSSLFLPLQLLLSALCSLLSALSLTNSFIPFTLSTLFFFFPQTGIPNCIIRSYEGHICRCSIRCCRCFKPTFPTVSS